MYKNSSRFFAKHTKLVKALPGSQALPKSPTTVQGSITIVCQYCKNKLKPSNFEKHLKKSHPTKLREGNNPPLNKNVHASKLAKNKIAPLSKGKLEREIRVYELARELEIPSKQIIQDVADLGVKVQVPSQKITQTIADKIRFAYTPEISAHTEHHHARLIKKQDFQAGKQKLVTSVSSEESIRVQTSTKEASLILESKKAEWVNEKRVCDKCLSINNSLWKYSKSSKGVVYLCSRCKPIVYTKSFGNKDALDVAQQGGRFESNRRKY